MKKQEKECKEKQIDILIQQNTQMQKTMQKMQAQLDQITKERTGKKGSDEGKEKEKEESEVGKQQEHWDQEEEGWKLVDEGISRKGESKAIQKKQ